MACMMRTMIRKLQNINFQLIKQFHFNPIMHLDQKWREKRKLTVNPNSFGPLTNLPDYSFADGRVVPYGVRQKERIDKQQQMLTKIKKLVGEIDNAVLRHKQLEENKTNKKKLLVETGLKEKKIPFIKPSKKLL